MKVRGDSKPQATTTDSRSLRFEFVEIFGFTLAPLCGKLNFFSPVADYFSLHQPEYERLFFSAPSTTKTAFTNTPAFVLIYFSLLFFFFFRLFRIQKILSAIFRSCSRKSQPLRETGEAYPTPFSARQSCTLSTFLEASWCWRKIHFLPFCSFANGSPPASLRETWRNSFPHQRRKKFQLKFVSAARLSTDCSRMIFVSLFFFPNRGARVLRASGVRSMVLVRLMCEARGKESQSMWERRALMIGNDTFPLTTLNYSHTHTQSRWKGLMRNYFFMLCRVFGR